MQLNHLKYLQAINQYGSMNKAAKELFVTQPTLTKAIQKLEKDLGGSLIERTANGVILTDFGKIVLQDSQQILGYVENWRSIASNASISTPITVHLTGSAPRFEFASSILYIKKEHPDLDVHIRYTENLTGRFPSTNPSPRIIVQYCEPDDIKPAKEYAGLHDMELAVLQKDEFVLFFNFENPFANKQQISLSDLHDSEVMLYHSPHGEFPYMKKLGSVNCKVGVQMLQEENLMLALMLNPNTVTIRPLKTALHTPYVDNGIIQIRHLIDCPMPIDLCIFYPSKDRSTYSEQLFINALTDYFPEFTQL